MTLVSDAYTDKLRNGHPHTVKPYMSIIKPTVVYCGTVTGSPDFGDVEITVSNVSGSLSNVAAGMTVFVGTSCGDYSKSKRRYKSRASQVLTFDENSVDWQNGDYITIINYYEYWNIYPRITTEEPFIFYKDNTITYSDQNLYPNPVAIISGGHKAGFLDGPSITFPISGILSYTMAAGATITGYSWSGSSGLVFANSAIATTTVTISATGYYWLVLTVTDSNGKTQSTKALIRVHDRDEDMPFVRFTVPQPLSHDWNSNGWRTSIECYEDFDIDNYPDNTLVIIWGMSEFNGVESYYDDNIILAGHLRKGSIQKVQDTGTVTFEIETLNAVMNNRHMYSMSLEYSTNPNKWYKYYKLTAARILHHYFKWHSTLFEIANVFLPVSETTEINASDDFDAGGMLSQAETFAYERSIFAHIMCDKHDAVQIRQDIHLLPDATRAANQTLINITNEDHLPEVEVVLNTEKIYSHIIVSGGRRNPNDNTLFPIISQAPGELPENDGSEKNVIEYLIIASQSAGNVLAGRVLANLNRYIEEVRLKLAGNYHSILECLPQYWIHLYDAQNIRGIPLAGNYTLKSVTTQLDTKAGTMMSDIVLIPDVESTDGIPGPYPEDPEDNGGGGGGGGGGIHPPPWVPPVPPDPIVDPTSDVYAAIADDVMGTNNFGDTTPNWDTKLVGVTGTIIDATRAAWDPTFNVIYVLTETSVWKTEDFQVAVPTWTEVYDVTADAELGDKNPSLGRIVTPPTISGTVYVLASAESETVGNISAFLIKSIDGGTAWTVHEVLEDAGFGAALPFTLSLGEAFTMSNAESSVVEALNGSNGGEVHVVGNRCGITHQFPTIDEGYYSLNPPSAMSSAKIRVNGNVMNCDYSSAVDTPDGAARPMWWNFEFEDYSIGTPTCPTASDIYTYGPLTPTTIYALVFGHSSHRGDSRNDCVDRNYDWTWEIIEWNGIPVGGTPTALDCGKHDGNKIYVGTPNNIMRSVDGGETWEEYVSTLGANDIECHSLQTADDDITIWGTDGSLYRVIAGDLGDDLYTETTPTAVPYRICSDPMTPDVIYALPNGTLLIKWTDGSIPALKIGLTGARSLVIKPGATLALRRIFFLSDARVEYSIDDGDNWLDKTGDWAGYGSPIRIEPLE